MSESEPSDLLKNRRFYAGFFACLALFVALNAGSYFIYSSPEGAAKSSPPLTHKVGLPRVFWVEDKIGFIARLSNPGERFKPIEPEFYWLDFTIDAGLALLASSAAGGWLARRGERAKVAEEGQAAAPVGQ